MEKYGNSNMIGYYNVLDIRCDAIAEEGTSSPVYSYITFSNGATSVSTTSSTSYVQEVPSPHESDSLVESRISIKDYHQLSGLYRFMQDLPEFCLLHEGGGIHIHVDISKYVMDKKIVIPYLTKRLDEIGSIFPLYTGKYNNKEVGWRHKSTWLNLSNLGTMEFRIAPLTFDYNTLINWVFKLIKFRQKFIHDCRLYKGTSEVLEAIQINDAINSVAQRLEALPTTGYWTDGGDSVNQTP